MSYTPESGHVGPSTLWRVGKLEIYRHCDGVFELLCDGNRVMPVGTFEQINRYLWGEFYIPGFKDEHR